MRLGRLPARLLSAKLWNAQPSSLSTMSFGTVEEHGGSIEVESQPGEGSCFRILLPRGHAA